MGTPSVTMKQRLYFSVAQKSCISNFQTRKEEKSINKHCFHNCFQLKGQGFPPTPQETGKLLFLAANQKQLF